MTQKDLRSRLTRRGVLGSAAGLVLALQMPRIALAEVPPVGAALEPGLEPARFRALSQLLTARPALDEGIAARAQAGLTAVDAAFPQKAAALLARIEAIGMTDIGDFARLEAADPAAAATARSIISAWYLGHTGTPEGEKIGDNAQFVTFTGALMFEPTIDATIIPTYARGRTNYWAAPPASIARD